MEIKTRSIAQAGMIAAAYVVVTFVLAPISYNVFQFRVSEALKPLALFSPIFALSFGIGNFIANLASPFGILDWGVMPFVDAGAALLCWWLRRWPVLAIVMQAVIISAGVSVFPLGLGAGLPLWLSFFSVLISELILLIGGYFVIWRRYGPYLLRGWQRSPGPNRD